MAVVVTDNCEGCRFTECVKVCPVACFHGDDGMVYIDSEACIDCCACIPVCPVQAIYLEGDLPPEKAKWLDINSERAAVLPLVTKPSEPLPTAAARRAALGF
jgi:ferredoxin